MTFSFSLRVTIWQVVQTAFSFFLVRHLCTRASRPQHLSSAIFCSVRTDWTGSEPSPVRAHTLTRSRSWASRNHKTLTNLWRSKGLRRWVLLSNVRTFSLPPECRLCCGSDLALPLGLNACSRLALAYVIPYCYYYLRVQNFAILGFWWFCGY